MNPGDDDDVCLQKEGGVSAQTDERTEQSDQSDDEDKENDDGDDGGGWITPSNIKQVKMDSADWTAPADITVGCLTTDFAMQVTEERSHCFSPFVSKSLLIGRLSAL